MFVDILVPKDGLRHIRGGIVIPIVLATVPNKETAERFELPDKLLSLLCVVRLDPILNPGIGKSVEVRVGCWWRRVQSRKDAPPGAVVAKEQLTIAFERDTE